MLQKLAVKEQHSKGQKPSPSKKENPSPAQGKGQLAEEVVSMASCLRARQGPKCDAGRLQSTPLKGVIEMLVQYTATRRLYLSDASIKEQHSFRAHVEGQT